MDKIQYQGQKVPILTKSGAPGDIVYKSEEDEDVTASERKFVQKNLELQNAITSQGPKPPPMEEEIRRSTLVEIPTPTSRVVYRANAVWPFDFFPNSIVIDELKVSFIYNGFLTRSVNSVLIKDITDVQVSTTLFFGAILINGADYQGYAPSKPGDKGPLTITYLPKAEAFECRRVIQGLMIFYSQKVDTSQMSVAEIIAKTENLGKTRDT